ncbi:hypothetical protein P3T37_001309 [Kitasatospora sp. MAA4]|uniref:hypothetical protein n=1 Tax=Kitasatospora sp. MAA4 TaxID=3035093 RepID=UPI002475B29C|nr:hypothetical protein [Kitasatospora sp. MAA4]MDH6131935.1 hypothetical protein [Kitasatospora sp. MAA4]
MTTRTTLTKAQAAILTAVLIAMLGIGAAGAVGTYTNVNRVWHGSGTAISMVAAGEGATMIMALVVLALVMIGQSAPAWVRYGMWVVPAVASVVIGSQAHTFRDAAVYAVSPVGMSTCAEGVALIARRVAVYRTGVDVDVQRRTADTVRQIAYHQARAQQHPDEATRADSERKMWELAERLGKGDVTVSAGLVGVHRDRMTQGADAALSTLYGAPAPLALPAAPQEPAAPALPPASTTNSLPAAPAPVFKTPAKPPVVWPALPPTQPVPAVPTADETARALIDAVNSALRAVNVQPPHTGTDESTNPQVEPSTPEAVRPRVQPPAGNPLENGRRKLADQHAQRRRQLAEGWWDLVRNGSPVTEAEYAAKAGVDPRTLRKALTEYPQQP